MRRIIFLISFFYIPIVLGAPAITKYTYIGGNQVIVTDPRGNQTTTEYQSFGDPDQEQVRRIKQPNGTTTVISRNVMGLVTAITQGSFIRAFSYDKHHYLISEHNPETGITTYGRNLLGQMISKKIGNSPVTTYKYDALGQLININYPTTSTPSIVKSYDANGQLTRVNNGISTWKYTYDANGNLTNAVLSTQGETFSITYSYDNLDHVSVIIYPDATKLDLFPNALGEPTKMVPFITNITYFPNEKVHSFTETNGISTVYTLNDRQMTNSIQVGHNGANLINRSYIYDPAGNLSQVTDLINSSNNRSFKYNTVNWLTNATGPWGTDVTSYDVNGNITQKNVGDQQLSYIYNHSTDELNNITGTQNETFTYDFYGDITTNGISQFIYNDSQELIQASGKNEKDKSYKKIEYTYDGNGNRISLHEGDETTFEAHQDSKLLYKLIKEVQAVDYIYLGGHKIIQLKHKISELATTADAVYLHNDLLGSPILQTNAAGNTQLQQEYLPYGNELNETPQDDNPHTGYTGKQHNDDSGLSYFGGRYYDPTIGRFMAIDPKDINPEVPLSFNRYVYANDNPYKFKDENGKWPDIVEQIMGASIGAATGWSETQSINGSIIGGGLGLLTSFVSAAASETVTSAILSSGFTDTIANGLGNLAKIPVNTGGLAISSKINTGKAQWGDAILGGISGFAGTAVVSSGFSSSGLLGEVGSAMKSAVMAGNTYLVGKSLELGAKSQIKSDDSNSNTMNIDFMGAGYSDFFGG